ncbi:MAG: putative sulfate exporter family transporter [Bacillota bacterium]
MKITEIPKIAPGFLVAVAIAFVATWLEELLPIHLIGASVIALFIGVLINSFWNPKPIMAGLKFTSKKVLKFAIILLGASLSISTILTVGKLSLYVMFFTLLTCFGGGYFIGKAFKLNWKLSNLISAGTGICGGSAIAAIAPVIDAEDTDIAYAMSATFIFDMIMILLFPIMGNALGLSDMAYGLWAGTAVNDTSSVVAAGYAFSEGAGDFATMVKLTRTLSIIPTVLVFAFINVKIKQKEGIATAGAISEINTKAEKYEVSQTDKIAEISGGNTAVKREKAVSKVNFLSLFPWFIVGFIALAVVNSFGIIPASVSAYSKTLSKFLMVAALAAIGLNTSFKDMKKSGIRPMLHGFTISLLVVIVALASIYFMGLI